MAHPNADLVRRGFEAFGSGDMATLDQIIADDATWHAFGRTPLSGDFVGKEAIFGSFARVMEETDSIQQDIHGILADDEHTVALVTGTITRGGKTFVSRQVFVFHIKDGKVTEAFVTQQDPYAADEFWAS